MRIKLLWLTLYCLLSVKCFSQAENIWFTTFPCLSADGDFMVFSCQGDLWKVSVAGGLALRLTAMEGYESRPRVSPDGKWLAFSCNMYGNDDVFLMPVAGGEIVRLTYHQGFDHVDSWSWDSQYIYLTSDRYNLHSGYKVHISGATPERVFDDGYFNNSHHLVEHPTSGEVYFNESWESKRYAHRMGYKGPYNPDIKSFNLKTKEYKQYTDWEGKDFWPTMDKNGNLYFVSDRDNGSYNLFVRSDNRVRSLTHFDDPVKRPQVSADGTKVVFEHDYQISVYDVATGEVTKPIIRFHPYDRLSVPSQREVQGEITGFDVSPDGGKLAFIAGGELFVSDISGELVRKLATPLGGRVVEVLWGEDSEQLIYNQTVGGYLNLFRARLDGREQALTTDSLDNRRLVLDSARRHLLYISGIDQLKELNLSTGKSQQLLKEEFWGIYNSSPVYAPGSTNYILYAPIRNLERDIFIYNKQTKKSINLTRSGVGEFLPVFSPSGKSIYYTSDRFKPSFPRGPGSNHIYQLPLAKYSQPFRSDALEELVGAKMPKPREAALIIDTIDMLSRVNLLGPSFGHQMFPQVIDMDGEDIVLYTSNHDEHSWSLWMTRKKRYGGEETKRIAGTQGASKYSMRSAGNSYYLLFNGAIHSLNMATAQAKKIAISHLYDEVLRTKFEQMFYETWSNVLENYYDEHHSLNIDSIRQQYEVFLPHVSNRHDLRMLINDMLGALNTSHMGFVSYGKEEKTPYSSHTLASGIMFSNSHPYSVKNVLHNSAADKWDLEIREGDELIAVNGEFIERQKNREYYFQARSFRDEVSLQFRRGEEITYEVKIHPERFESFRDLLYDDWERANEAYVKTKSGDRIAYIHMKDMSGQSYDHFVYKMTSLDYQKEGLILDLRYNVGGNVHDDVLRFLSQKQYFQWRYRGGEMAPQPNFIPASKPIVLLINEQTLSDGEVTAEGFKTLGLGKVIGMPTYRWIIFTTTGRLVDGSQYRLPTWGCYTLDGQDLEKTGVQPDIQVAENFGDRYAGKNPQLERAIAEVLNQLAR